MATQETIKQLNVGGVLRDVEDVTARGLISSLQTAFDALTSGDTTTAIESFNEIVAFLENVSDSSTLQGIIAGLNTSIAAKYTKPSTGIPASDLAQAVQTILNSVANKANSADVYPKSQTYTKSEVDAAVANKQDNISDLAEIRTNSKKGIANVSTPATPDGTAVITLANGDTFTLNLNHTHSQYASKKTVTSTSESSVTLSADVVYDLGAVAGDKTISLPSTVDAAAEYKFRFSYTSGNITLPSGVAVANDATFSPTAGKTYQVVICGGIMYFSETTISA